MSISRKKISVIWGSKRLIDFLQIEAAFRKTNYTTFSYLLIPIYGQDMSEIEFLTACAGCSMFTDIWASENRSLRASEGRRYSSSAKSRKFTNVCTVRGRFLPPDPPPPHPTIHPSVKFREFEELIFIV